MDVATVRRRTVAVVQIPLDIPGETRSGFPGCGDTVEARRVRIPALRVGGTGVAPGDSFNFHHHPNQEEVIYVTEGSLEGWVDEEKTIMRAGDSLVLPPGTVHACFNVSDQTTKMVVVLSPKIETEEMGFELVDVSSEEPWASLRQ